jgi:hypothetical protein
MHRRLRPGLPRHRPHATTLVAANTPCP